MLFFLMDWDGEISVLAKCSAFHYDIWVTKLRVNFRPVLSSGTWRRFVSPWVPWHLQKCFLHKLKSPLKKEVENLCLTKENVVCQLSAFKYHVSCTNGNISARIIYFYYLSPSQETEETTRPVENVTLTTKKHNLWFGRLWKNR